jgi:hypothetical protein
MEVAMYILLVVIATNSFFIMLKLDRVVKAIEGIDRKLDKF